MTVLASVPQWPQGDQGKVLLHLLVDGSVDSLFDDLFGSYPELQAKLHRQRNDTNCAETPWVPQRADLPGQQFMWPAPPAGADPGTPGQGKCRKVRFEAAPSMASKAFSSEEVQVIHAYSPGSHYLVQAEVYTTAMYGDQFCIISRTSLVARGPDKTQLHIIYAIHFKPTISRLLKPMVAKGVDGGIRGTFSLLKKLLQEQYTLRDLPETAVGPEMPGEAAPAAAVPAVLVPAPVTQPVPAAAAVAASPLLFQLADYIVYQELVSGILKVSDPSVVVKGFAICLTLAMLHVMITLLRPILQACSAASSNGGLIGLLCWPLVGVLDLPDNITEVLSALLLVAAANRLLMLGTEAASVWMRAPAASRHLSGLPPDVSLPNGELPAPAEAAEAAGAGSAVSRAGSTAAVRRSTASGQLSPSAAAAVAPTSPAAAPAPASGTPGTPIDNVFNNLGHVVSGWGRNLLGGNTLDTIFTGASWSRPSSAAAMTAELDGGRVVDKSGQGPGSAGGPDGLTSPASSTAGSSSTTPARALGHRHTTSFTATMDPSGLNIIEDYAPEPQQQQQQQQQQHMPRLAEEQQQQSEQHKRPGTPSSAPAGAAGSTAAGEKGSAAEAAVESSPARSASPDGTAAAGGGSGSVASSAASSRSASPTKAGAKKASRLAVAQAAATSSAAAAASQHHAAKPLKSVAREVLATDADTEGISRQGSLRQPLLVAASQSSMDESVNGAADSFTKQSEAPSAAAGSEAPTASATAAARSPARAASGTKAVAFSANTNSKEGSPSRLDRLAGSFSAGSAGSTGSHDRSSLARRSASPALWGNDSTKEAAAGGPGARPISRTSMRSDGLGDGLGYEALSSGQSYVVPGEEEEDEVLVEVFEHERVQPFRGWGHTWPGHFLPSDRVGHWGDRSGAPGGAMSMLFDRVAPKLPVGWAWKDDEWTVDMTGAEHEGCDADGWSYGMDFSWLTWPPGPQTGRPGLKSFVRRRRWVRTRERLPPGSYDLQSPELQQQLAAFQQQQQDMGRSSGGGSGAGEGGLMAGLGAGAGLFSQDSKAAAQAAAAQAAAAASQAATAMMNRFMRAVADLPAQGSGGGSVPTSPPAGALAASPGRADSAGGPPPRSTPVTAVAVDTAASQHAVFSPTSSRPEAVPAVTPGTGQADGAAAAAESSAVDDVDSSSSSSVDSGTPPPRPQFTPAASEDLAEGQGPQAHSPVRQLQQQLEQEAAASTPLAGSAAPADSSGAFGTVSKQPSAEQEASASAAVQESSQESPAAALAPSASTAEAEVVADAEPLAGLRPSTVTSSGDWEWSVARVASPGAATAGGSSNSSGHATDSEAASASAQTASHAGSTAAHSGSTERAAAAAAPTGTPISTLRKAGSGITGTGSPRVGGAGRGAARGLRSSSGGGSRSGRGKLGAVSLRHSAEAALRSSSGGAAWGSGVLLSPTASQAVAISPATLLAAGGTGTESSVDSSAFAESEFASTSTATAAAATTVPGSGAATSTFGSGGSSSRVASTSAAAVAARSSSHAASCGYFAGMCEGMSGSLSPLRAAAGTTDTVGGTTTVLTAPNQGAVTPAAVTAEPLLAGSRVGQGTTSVLAASAARETAGSSEIGCSSSEAAAAQVAVRALGSKATMTAAPAAAAAAAAGLSEAAAAQSEPATAGPGPGTSVGDTSDAYVGGISALQSERANATSPFSTNSAQSVTSIGPAADSTAAGEELGAGLDAADSTASGTSAASSAAAAGDTAGTAVQDAGAADPTSADEATQASSTADVASEAVGSVGDAVEGGAAGGAAGDAAAGHISASHTAALGSSTSNAATGGIAEGVHVSAHGSHVPGETASLIAAAEGGEGTSAADVPQEGRSASGEWTAW